MNQSIFPPEIESLILSFLPDNKLLHLFKSNLFPILSDCPFWKIKIQTLFDVPFWYFDLKTTSGPQRYLEISTQHRLTLDSLIEYQPDGSSLGVYPLEKLFNLAVINNCYRLVKNLLPKILQLSHWRNIIGRSLVRLEREDLSRRSELNLIYNLFQKFLDSESRRKVKPYNFIHQGDWGKVKKYINKNRAKNSFYIYLGYFEAPEAFDIIKKIISFFK